MYHGKRITTKKDVNTEGLIFPSVPLHRIVTNLAVCQMQFKDGCFYAAYLNCI